MQLCIPYREYIEECGECSCVFHIECIEKCGECILVMYSI